MPFSCIVMEIFFILKSFWALKMYYIFDTLLIIFLLLMAVTASSSIVGSYVLLSAEDYRWQWSSRCLADENHVELLKSYVAD